MRSRTRAQSALALLCLPVLQACTTDEPPPNPAPFSADPMAMIVDIDADYDDIAALAYLCQEQRLGRVHLLAVTVTGNGAGYPGKGLRHTRCLLRACDLPDVLVAESAPSAANTFPDEIRQTIDTVLDTVFAGCTVGDEPSPPSAAQTIARAALASPSPVTLVTLGPLTNVAEALRIEPRLKDHIESVNIMGGAVSVPGNLCCGAPASFDGTQELNIWGDPAAADAVIHGLAPAVRLVALDATQDAPITRDFVARLEDAHPTKEASVVAGIVAHPSMTAAIDAGVLFWWDPLDAVAAVHPGVITYHPQDIVVVQGGASEGRTMSESDGARIMVGVKGDRARFEGLFLDTLNGK